MTPPTPQIRTPVRRPCVPINIERFSGFEFGVAGRGMALCGRVCLCGASWGRSGGCMRVRVLGAVWAVCFGGVFGV
jgi:hypothetical protein